MNMKKLFVYLLAAAVAVCGFSGCKEEKNTGGTDSGQKTYTYWCTIQSQLMTVYQSLNDVAMYKEIEKKTGVHIEFIHPAASQEAEQFNLMIASRELPDMIEYNWNLYPGGVSKAIEDNIIVPLNDYMNQLPNYSRYVTNGDDFEKGAKTDSGDYFGFASLNPSDYFNFAGLMLRKDWLDELHLPVPETIEEWETVLRAFRDEKGASAPLTGLARMFQPNNVESTFNNAFQVGKELYLDGGKVKYGPMEPAHKEYIACMNRWYAEGLIDKDFSTNTTNIVEAKIITGDAGAVFGSVGSSMGVYLEKMEGDPSYDLVGAPYPVAKKGDPAYYKYSKGNSCVVAPYLCITSQCSDAEGAAKWADFIYSDEGYMLFNFGVEGETYNMVDGKPVYTDLILNNPEGISISEALMRYCKAPYTAPGVNQAEDYLQQFYQFDEQKEAFTVWEAYPENSDKGFLPPISYSAEETEEISIITTEINTYVEENLSKFVTGSRPMDEYDDFVNTLKTMGVERYIELTQNAYDRYMAR